MHKYAKLTTVAMFGALIVGATSGCSGKKDLTLWVGFGSSYTNAVNTLVENYTNQSGVTLEVTSAGSYDKLQTKINNSLGTDSYPNFSHGYPDHFAGYIKGQIQLELDNYISEYDKEHGTNLLEDFYPEYMVENKSLKYDASGKPYVMGIPFNKSTEVLGYNSAFVDYAIEYTKQTSGVDISLPTTWQQLANEGQYYVETWNHLKGNYLHGQPIEGQVERYNNWKVSANAEEAGYTMVLNMKDVVADKFRLMCWDSADNMFITLVRQWGSEYTTCTAEDLKNPGHGWAKFYSGENKEKTKAALSYFKALYDKKYIGLPSDVSDQSYSSSAFKNNQTMFVICSSGGLSYNVESVPFKVAPIPYFNDGTKYVISQGTNLCLFDQGSDEDKKKAFNAMVSFATGELQGSWAATTGYYPGSKSGTNSTAYQKLLTEEQDNPKKRAYQESAILNEKEYMDTSKNWVKFVDPAFVGSSAIRSEIKSVMGMVFNGTDLDKILSEVYTRIKDYVKD